MTNNTENKHDDTLVTATFGGVTISIGDNRPLKTGEHPYTVEAIVGAFHELFEKQALCKKDLRNIIAGLKEDAKEPPKAPKKMFDYQGPHDPYGPGSFRDTYNM